MVPVKDRVDLFNTGEGEMATGLSNKTSELAHSFIEIPPRVPDLQKRQIHAAVKLIKHPPFIQHGRETPTERFLCLCT